MGIIRLLLALSVVYVHFVDVFPLTDNRLVGGVVAVQSFYIISGFYMALVLNQGYIDKRAFYFNRFLRIFPTYWFTLTVSVISALALHKETFISAILNSKSLHLDGKIFMLFANIFIFGSDAMMFLFPATNGLRFTANFGDHAEALWSSYHAIPQAWTLPVEMSFYAIAPFVVRNWLRLLVIFLASIILRYFVYRYVSPDDPWTYRFFPLEVAFFCVGALLFYAYQGIKLLPIGNEIGLIFLVVMIVYITNFSRVPTLTPNVTLFSGNLFQFYLLAIAAVPFIFQVTKDNRIDRWLGEMSYPIYITHWLIIEILPSLPTLSGKPAFDVLFYVLSFSAAVALFVQGPIEKALKRKSTRDEQAPIGLIRPSVDCWR